MRLATAASMNVNHGCPVSIERSEVRDNREGERMTVLKHPDSATG